MASAQPAQPVPAHHAPAATGDGETATSRHVVEVNEVAVHATGRGADWWATFLIAHRDTGRITTVDVTLGGATCRVACDSKDDAEWLATAMVQQRGLPRSAVKARVLGEGGAR